MEGRVSVSAVDPGGTGRGPPDTKHKTAGLCRARRPVDTRRCPQTTPM